jgi:carbamate kinase
MRRRTRKPILLVALGGNALIRKGQRGTFEEQVENLAVPIRQIARLSRDHRILITHGNGPQVGNLLLQQESCKGVPRMPLEILVAQTQGQIGYMIESALDSELMRMGVHTTQRLVSLIGYVVVNERDPGFNDLSKPIGPAFSRRKAAALPYPTRKTARGYRRVVASPRPVTIVEKREIRDLLERNFIVICCGGGGIPVARDGRTFSGVSAVIDKDLASARLAEETGVDVFVIATDVRGAALNYETPRQRFLRKLTPGKAARYLARGHFPPGTMAPKIESCVEFVKRTGKRAAITSIEAIEKAVAGRAGTQFADDGHD